MGPTSGSWSSTTRSRSASRWRPWSTRPTASWWSGSATTGEESLTAVAGAASRPGADGRQPARHRRDRGHPSAHRSRRRPVVVLLSTYDGGPVRRRRLRCRGLRRQGGVRAGPAVRGWPPPAPGADRRPDSSGRDGHAPSPGRRAVPPTASTRSMHRAAGRRRSARAPLDRSTRSSPTSDELHRATGRRRRRLDAAEVDRRLHPVREPPPRG